MNRFSCCAERLAYNNCTQPRIFLCLRSIFKTVVACLLILQGCKLILNPAFFLNEYNFRISVFGASDFHIHFLYSIFIFSRIRVNFRISIPERISSDCRDCRDRRQISEFLSRHYFPGPTAVRYLAQNGLTSPPSYTCSVHLCSRSILRFIAS